MKKVVTDKTNNALVARFFERKCTLKNTDTGVIYIIYLCVNVVLDLMGYKVYDCKLNDEGAEIEKKILSKRKLRSETNHSLVYTAINNDYVIDITGNK